MYKVRCLFRAQSDLPSGPRQARSTSPRTYTSFSPLFRKTDFQLTTNLFRLVSPTQVFFFELTDFQLTTNLFRLGSPTHKFFFIFFLLSCVLVCLPFSPLRHGHCVPGLVCPAHRLLPCQAIARCRDFSDQQGARGRREVPLPTRPTHRWRPQPQLRSNPGCHSIVELG